MSSANGIGDLKQAVSALVPATPAQQSVQTQSNESNRSAPTAPQSDEATLSTTGGIIAQALQGSDVRTAKIEALQKTIASGSYSVSASDVADKMIQSLLD